MKQVRMNLSIVSSEDWSYYPGQIVELDDELASVWHMVGHCTILELENQEAQVILSDLENQVIEESPEISSEEVVYEADEVEVTATETVTPKTRKKSGV